MPMALFTGSLPEDRLFISVLSIIELTSGVLRLVKGGQLRGDTANEILATFRRDIGEILRVWPLNEEVAISAVRVVEEHKLRSADAIHLATAQLIASLAPHARTVIVSSDRELLDAGNAAGLVTVDPQAHDAMEKLKQLRG